VRLFLAAAAFAAVATLALTPPFVDPNTNPDAVVATLQQQMAAEASARAEALPSVATPAQPELTPTPEPTPTSRARAHARASASLTPPPSRVRRSPSTTPSESTTESTSESTSADTTESTTKRKHKSKSTTTETTTADKAGSGGDSGRSTGPPPPPTTTQAGGGARFLAIARTIANGPLIPYGWGGKDIDRGVDCSGFVWNVLRRGGLDVPYRDSRALASWGTAVSAADAQPGDLALWRGHVAIYAGGDMIVDASSAADDITERKLWGRPTFRRVPS
jgi:cell wall-associated NlpC family hydrolase